MKILQGDNFNYWAREHYEVDEVTGSHEHCINFFKKVCVSYPSKKFSTHVWHKQKKEDGTYRYLIRRFKTEKLFQIHVEYPPTYVRTGESL
jgi:hypothetical protein